MANETPLYDAFSRDYDRFVNWPARLEFEMPFFERLFAEHGVHRVLDVACGTGQHAIALARRGYEAVGADISQGMIARARENAAQADGAASFVVAGFGELAQKVEGPFDAVTCLGNSLSHLLSDESLAAALSDMAAILNPGGLLVVQTRNYDRVWARRERFMPLETRREGDREWLFLRMMDFHTDSLTFNLITLRKQDDQWSYSVESTEVRPIFRDQLAALLRETGFSAVDFYGDYRRAPFRPDESGDLIAVARL